MKSTPTNEYFSSTQRRTLEPVVSKQEKDMFVMKAIILLAKENISRKNIKKVAIRVVEESKENVCSLEMVVPLSNKTITLKGQFKRLSEKHSFPVKDSFSYFSS